MFLSHYQIWYVRQMKSACIQQPDTLLLRLFQNLLIFQDPTNYQKAYETFI